MPKGGALVHEISALVKGTQRALSWSFWHMKTQEKAGVWNSIEVTTWPQCSHAGILDLGHPISRTVGNVLLLFIKAWSVLLCCISAIPRQWSSASQGEDLDDTSLVYDHVTFNIPVLVWSQEPSKVVPGSYLEGRRNQTWRHLVLEFSASRTVKNEFLLFKPPDCGILLC